jgi:hypothetical protein
MNEAHEKGKDEIQGSFAALRMTASSFVRCVGMTGLLGRAAGKAAV